MPPPQHRSQRVAVVVIDVFSDFRFDGGSRLLRALKLRLPPLENLLAKARRCGVPVIYVNDCLGTWDSNFPRMLHEATNRRGVRPIVERLVPQSDDVVIVKPRHSAFYGTALEPVLERLRVSNLVLAGVSSESCVWMTATDAHTRGFSLVVPQDTMAGLSTRAVRAMLTGLREVIHARTPRTAASVRFRRGLLQSPGK